jgi:hypothetical protein
VNFDGFATSIGLATANGQMPECSEIGLMLGAAGDGELEPRDLQQVAHHLVGCTNCTGELSDYSKIGRELRAIATTPSLQGFTKSVLNVIAKIAAVAMLAIALHTGIVRLGTADIARTLPATVASKSPASPAVAGPAKEVDVRVDSAVVADRASGSFNHTSGRTVSGKMLVFALPGGKVLHVQPKAIEGGMIRMEVVLFEGGRATMTVDLNLQNGSTLALGGAQFEKGTLLLRISPTTTASASTFSPNLL